MHGSPPPVVDQITHTLQRRLSLNTHRRLEQWLTIAGAAVLAVAVCFSRLRLGYHTKEQVAVGALVGAFVGWLWQLFVTKVRVPSWNDELVGAKGS